MWDCQRICSVNNSTEYSQRFVYEWNILVVWPRMSPDACSNVTVGHNISMLNICDNQYVASVSSDLCDPQRPEGLFGTTKHVIESCLWITLYNTSRAIYNIWWYDPRLSNVQNGESVKLKLWIQLVLGHLYMYKAVLTSSSAAMFHHVFSVCD